MRSFSANDAGRRVLIRRRRVNAVMTRSAGYPSIAGTDVKLGGWVESRHFQSLTLSVRHDSAPGMTILVLTDPTLTGRRCRASVSPGARASIRSPIAVIVMLDVNLMAISPTGSPA